MPEQRKYYEGEIARLNQELHRMEFRHDEYGTMLSENERRVRQTMDKEIDNAVEAAVTR